MRKNNTKAVSEMIGRRYGHLVVIAPSEERIGRAIAWLCECDCGSKKVLGGNTLRSGRVVSCGCVREKIKSAELSSLLNEGVGTVEIARRLNVSRQAVLKRIRKMDVLPGKKSVSDAIRDACEMVFKATAERDDDDYLWEDAVVDCGLSPEMGAIVLAVMYTSARMTAQAGSDAVNAFLGVGGTVLSQECTWRRA